MQLRAPLQLAPILPTTYARHLPHSAGVRLGTHCTKEKILGVSRCTPVPNLIGNVATLSAVALRRTPTAASNTAAGVDAFSGLLRKTKMSLKLSLSEVPRVERRKYLLE
jgi:hypothetical protein